MESKEDNILGDELIRFSRYSQCHSQNYLEYELEVLLNEQQHF